MIALREAITTHRNLTRIIFLFILFSGVTLGVNALVYQYPGNVYFPKQTPWVFIILLFIYSGFYLQYGKHSTATQKTRAILQLFATMALILVGCTAAQFTPFPPIDTHILKWGEWMHIDFVALVHWSRTHPVLNDGLDILYDSIALQMTYLPLLLILFGHFKRVHEYCFLLLITALIGYGFYYFFPTTAPASMFDSPDFTTAQHATSLKFRQIHAHIPPTTLEGGMIAFPSFHVIWAWLCSFLVRDWRFAFGLVLLVNIAVTCSCVLLGWHYILDVAASIIVLAIAHYIYCKSYPTTGTP